MELIAELRHRASEVGEGWSDHKMMLRAADEIERLQNTLREIYQQPDVLALLREATALRAAIQKTLDENGHLADGDNCTLVHLVRAIETPNAI